MGETLQTPRSREATQNQMKCSTCYACSAESYAGECITCEQLDSTQRDKIKAEHQVIIADQLRLNVAWEDLVGRDTFVYSRYNEMSWAMALERQAKAEAARALSEYHASTCLPGCMNPAKGLHHRVCPNYVQEPGFVAPSAAARASRKAARAYWHSEPLLCEQLREIFLRVNGTKTITSSEFKKALTGKRKDGFRAVLQTQGKNWKDVFAALDTNHDGAVSCDEFIVAVSTSPDSTGRDIVDSAIVRPTAPTPQEMDAYYRSSPYHEDNYYNSHGD